MVLIPAVCFQSSRAIIAYQNTVLFLWLEEEETQIPAQKYSSLMQESTGWKDYLINPKNLINSSFPSSYYMNAVLK